MAFALAELFVNIGAKTTSLDRALSGIRGKLAATSTAIGTFAGNVASRLASMAVPLAGDVLGGAAIAMENRIAALAKATDLAGPALAGMKQELFGLSTSLRGVKLDDLLKITTIGAKMGIAQEDLLRYTEGVAKISVALDDMSAEDIADNIGKINNIWKLGVEGTFQLGSAVDKLADSGASSAEQIFNVMQRIGKSTKGLGMSAQESLALATAITDTGTRSEQASTSLIQLTNALVDVESHATFAKVLGISASEFAENVKKDPTAAMKGFLAALQQLDAGSQNLALKGIGIEGAQNPTEIKGLAESLDSLAAHTARANHEFLTLDQLNKSYAVNSQLTSAAITVAQNRFQVMSVTIGDQLLPVITLASEAMGQFGETIAKSFAGKEESIARFRDSILSAATGMGSGTGLLVTSISAFPEAVHVAGLKVMNVLTNIGTGFVWLKDSAVVVFSFIGQFVTNVFERVLANIRNLFGGVETAIGNLLTMNIGDVFKGEIDIFKGFKPDRGPAALLPEFKLPTLKLSVDPRIAEMG
jgi:TP901 family phage tail tape measure protein